MICMYMYMCFSNGGCAYITGPHCGVYITGVTTCTCKY